MFQYPILSGYPLFNKFLLTINLLFQYPILSGYPLLQWKVDDVV